jgi:Rrf2 family protein
VKIGRRAVYAVLAVMEIASGQEGVPVKIGDIASNRRIPRAYLEQILRELKTAGLVRSVRGADGGYLAARGLNDLSVARVLEAVGGIEQVHMPSHAQTEGPLAAALDAALEAARSKLDTVTVASLLRKEHQAGG